MNDLASRDAYIQQLTSKICSRPNQEPTRYKDGGDAGPPKKNKQNKKLRGKGNNDKVHTPKPNQKPPPRSTALKGTGASEPGGPKPKILNGASAAKGKRPKGGNVDSSFSTINVLRNRLHEKIEASRGQGTLKDPSSEAVQAKRAKRKLERERKKRKRKELLMKKLAEKAGKEEMPEIKQEEPVHSAVAGAGKRNEVAIIFNKLEMVEERYVDKKEKKKNKKKTVKGNLTPLTGKNYKQLLSRVEARKAKLEKLRETDEGKAQEMEEKMKWTNVLYKAEGLKIKDNEDMLRASLKKKEKMHSQKKKAWENRSQKVVEKMQKRQDKRRRNIQKSNRGKIEKKKDRARKKGRVLPGDLEKAAG
ncbi:surfeit locus protein 6 [Lampris incognitus]|uniref:surfeit locus protein 6 n=1 Tax=Lampris incognitus TaxID=2546036 RepID=UPI0024B5D46E|nr:surfeit locus protein 6 [Lampris incognitus]